MDTESSRVLLEKLKECAKRAKLHNNLFLGFGTLLGAIREKSVIKGDDDMDLCIMNATPQQKQDYLEECQKAGLMAGWPNPEQRITYKPDGEIIWFSCKISPKTTKCCNWFMFEWADMLWHTKGKMWVSDLHFDRRKRRYQNTDEAVMKGASMDLFQTFIPIKFLDLDFLIPKKSGALLDFWYPDWYHPRDACDSSDAIMCRVPNWYDKENWGII